MRVERGDRSNPESIVFNGKEVKPATYAANDEEGWVDFHIKVGGDQGVLLDSEGRLVIVRMHGEVRIIPKK